MKKRQIIGMIVMSVGILIVLFLISLLFSHTFSFQSENKLDTSYLETNYDVLSTLDPVVIGDSNTPVTIIAFIDYQCHDCKTWYTKEYSKMIESLIEPKKANMIFVDVTPFGDDSLLASEATYCANEQGKYSEYQEILFNSQREIDIWATSDQLKSFAIDLDMDPVVFNKCLESGKYESKILSNINYSKDLSIEKIPIFKIINFEGKEHILKGGMSSVVFENIVNKFQ